MSARTPSAGHKDAPGSQAVLRGPVRRLPDDATLAALVERQVTRTPEAVAVAHGRATLTYAELDARANRLAHELVALGVAPDVPVAVCAGRAVELAVGLLAVLKAGGACLPLDPAYPPRRLAWMLEDAAPPVLLTQQWLVPRLPDFAGRTVCLDGGGSSLARHPGTPSTLRCDPDHLAYVIYTSGSTGEPKGVMLRHRGLVNHSLAVAELYDLGPRDAVVQFCSIGFDVSIEELFPTWASGGRVVFRPEELPTLGDAWLAWLREVGATVLNLPTAYWHEWVRDLHTRGERVPATIRLVVVGGEKALGSAYHAWLQVGGDRVRWVNAYGPAETSVLATSYEPPPCRNWPADRDPPIGRPLANTFVAVLDSSGRPVPPGTVGDLHIGGVGLARGYLNRPDLTAERFVPDPFAAGADARLYRTGDLVQLLPEGDLAFVGRLDEQVKVRGFRIECAEVEGALARHPGVSEAAVVVREDEPGVKRLVAYVVAGGIAPPSPAELRRFLSDRLPRFMVPGAFVRLDALPLTAHGKVDRGALPPPGDPRAGLVTPRVAARTSTEEVIAQVWSQVLDVEVVGVDDDFFDLGGHSLQATQVVAKVRELLGVQLGVSAFFDGPTVGRLAALVDAERAVERIPPLVPRDRRPEQRVPLTTSQEQMWRLEANADPPGLFNVTALHRFDVPVDEQALRAALAHLVERHESLRTRFQADDQQVHQCVVPEVAVPLAVCDLAGGPAGDREAELRRRVAEQDAGPFDPAVAPLLRACLYRLGAGRSVLAATFDHLICDGTSAYVFLTELAAAYDAFAAGGPPALRPLAVQYPDFALWQRSWLTKERLQAQLDYWRHKLHGMPLGPTVPFDRVPRRPSRRVEARQATVPPQRYEALLRLARATRSTMFVVTAAAVQALFARVGDATDVVLSTTLSGRQRTEVDGLIGCFHGVGRIRTDLSGDPPFTVALERVRESVLGLFEHQDLPFWRVRQAVLPDFPAGGAALLAAVPVEFQYFHTAHDEWTPGVGVVERPGSEKGPDELFFRGQLHPLTVTFLDDGTQLWGELSYKPDFYEEATIERLVEGLGLLTEALARDPDRPLSRLPVAN